MTIGLGGTITNPFTADGNRAALSFQEPQDDSHGCGLTGSITAHKAKHGMFGNCHVQAV